MNWLKAKLIADGVAEVWINRVIGSDFVPDWFNQELSKANARMFQETLDGLGELTEIRVFLNSPGGDVYAGLAIANYLRAHPAAVHITVMGVAASIASVILMAGDTRVMAPGSQVMVHNPAQYIEGFYSAAALRDQADLVDQIRDAMLPAYTVSSDKSAEEWAALLDQGDTYMGYAEAAEWGLATAEQEDLQAVACAQLPAAVQSQLEMSAQLREKDGALATQAQELEALQAQVQDLERQLAPAAVTAEAVIAACDDANFKELAVDLVAQQLTEPALEARLAMAGEVRDLCMSVDVEAAPLLAHLATPVEMMRVLSVELKALTDPDGDSLNYQQRQVKQPCAKAAYNQLNNVPGGN